MITTLYENILSRVRQRVHKKYSIKEKMADFLSFSQLLDILFLGTCLRILNVGSMFYRILTS